MPQRTSGLPPANPDRSLSHYGQLTAGITMTAIIEQINSEKACELLLSNTHNRTHSRATVARYAEAMTRGEWKLSNDIICLSSKGVLMNGQHRLMAVYESETTQSFYVWYDCPEEALLTMDVGRKRDGADTASLATGVKMTKASAKALRLINTPLVNRSTVSATSNQLILWNATLGQNMEEARALLPNYYKNHALPIGAATEALTWLKSQGLDTEPGLEDISDFFSIVADMEPAVERPLDVKNKDYIPAQFNKGLQILVKEGKRFSTFVHYRSLLNALQSYLARENWGSAKRIDVMSRPVPARIFSRG